MPRTRIQKTDLVKKAIEALKLATSTVFVSFTKLSVKDLDELRKLVNVKVPDLLVAEEVNHRLAALVENITQLGLTTESYLQSKKLTPDTLKSQLTSQARSDLEAEFILLAIQQSQKLADRKSTLDFLQTLV